MFVINENVYDNPKFISDSLTVRPPPLVHLPTFLPRLSFKMLAQNSAQNEKGHDHSFIDRLRSWKRDCYRHYSAHAALAKLKTRKYFPIYIYDWQITVTPDEDKNILLGGFFCCDYERIMSFLFNETNKCGRAIS